ncbi:gluconokinase [Microbacterium allomyrinae]|jgi:gluconokinase|uniref:Gluconokinase n=1 Tax=Microbacterium allomyrinae TaxID=2830666 RepID=A0A9X1LS38_9MICO|nr:gluconokinase [Microbacterium allomyrinae]MCC2030711.1 gluconokinase [Microbacterium allomyrinae]
MGPSGSGKSVVGAVLAARLDLPFIDADDLHPEANVEKMTAGIPLDDDDRMPWLDIVAASLQGAGTTSGAGGGAVIACSALARRYRDRIRAGAPDALIVELQVSPDELARRMNAREHFMPPALLLSQLEALEHLESDESGFVVLNDRPPAEVVDEICATLDRAQSLR